MNAQQHWKGLYKLFIENPLDVMGVNCRNRMYQDRREAALERALEAERRKVNILAQLVRLKYGNLNPEVNKYLEEIGHGP